MPNYCQNEITIKGESQELQRLLDYVKTDEFDFDFNQFISMDDTAHIKIPKTKLIEYKNAYLAYYEDSEKQMVEWKLDSEKQLKKELAEIFSTPGTKKMADLYHYSQLKILPQDWYYWRLQYWGTKWNPASADIGDIIPIDNTDISQLTISFATAWNFPQPIFEYLGNIFPRLSFKIKVDEEAGFFYGNIKIVRGKYKAKIKEGKKRRNGPYS